MHKWPQTRRYLASSVIKKLKAKTTVRQHFTTTRTARIKKSSNSKRCEDAELRTLRHCCWEHIMVQWLCSSVWQVPSFNTERPPCPIISTPRHVPERTGNKRPLGNVHTNVYGSIFCKNQKVEEKRKSIKRGMSRYQWNYTRKRWTSYNVGGPWKHRAERKTLVAKGLTSHTPFLCPKSRPGKVNYS